ncbi:MAG: DUF3012 domain-containing protein [Gammaproteobacteria bacterium]|nr:DUF3012 domain-containing protein [Gammaproteobacteria bacterium]
MKSSILIIIGMLLLAGCSPEVGSDEWCEDMKEKPKGEWTANEIGDYTKYCVLNQKP